MLLQDCCCSLGFFHHDALYTFEGIGEYGQNCRCNLKIVWKSLKGGYGVITSHGGFEMVLQGVQLARSANCLGTDQASANCSVATVCEEAKREHIKEITTQLSASTPDSSLQPQAL